IQDGRSIATVGVEGTTRVWNRDGQLAAELPKALDSVIRASFSPGGSHLLTVSTNGSLHVWPLSPAAYESRASRIRLPCLTSLEMRDALMFGVSEANARFQRCAQGYRN